MKLDRSKLYPWLAILRAKFMGSGRAMALEKHFGSIEKALHASPDAVSRVKGFSVEIGQAIQEASKGKFDREIEKELKWAKREGVSILLYSDDEYPFVLRHIPAPPAILYVKGTLLPQDVLSFGIVGSRTASDHGRRQASKIACELAEAGLTIASGLAWGVDGSAHKGALRCKTGRTIAVLGNGLSIVYPREHGLLADQIVQRGALVTELFHDVTPQGRNFPPRNRIISGLSLGVLVVEASGKSGSLITANYALEQGKEVFALPGSVQDEMSLGTNRLIQDSAAKLITSSTDILEELTDKMTYYRNELTGKIPRVDISPLPHQSIEKEDQSEKPVTISPTPPAVKETVQPEAPPNNLSEDEQVVWSKLKPTPIHIDLLANELDWKVARVSAALGLLELKDFIERDSGMRFRLRDH